MKKRNRLLAILLTAILTISMLPSAAFASEAVDTGETAEAAVVEVSSVGEEQDAEATVEEVSTVEEAVEETAEAAEEDEEADAAEAEAEEAEADEEAAVEAATEDAAEPAADQEAEAAEEEAAETAEAEETAEPAAEIEEEVVPEEAAETVEWPITLESKGSDYTVTASFDESAGFSADTKMRVSEIKQSSGAYQDYYDQALETIQNNTEKNVELTEARFFDITFYTEEGEVEPTGPVNVSIKYRKSIDVESKDDVHVLHFDDNDNAAPQIMDIETDGRGDKVNEVSFETDGFSVYAVIGTNDPEDGENARMTVNFIGADGTTVGTMIVKNADKGKLDTIIYDPGAGTIPEGYVFYGWSVDDRKDKDGNYYAEEYDGDGYTVDTALMTIDQVKTHINSLLSTEEEQGITEGDVLNIYAAVFAHYTVEYFDEKGISRGSDPVKVKTPGDSVNYTVNMGYNVDDSHKFEGWIPVSDADIANIKDYPEGAKPTEEDDSVYYYENSTQISIKGDINFRVSAPEGKWLIFNENGKGATYTAPQFVLTGENTKEPTTDMDRYGYTFGGWYKNEACSEGQEFPFGSPLTTTTTIYAKWIPNETAIYTVLVWKQKVSGSGYDFAESKIIYNATVGGTITVTTTDTSATVADNTYSYDGFKYGHYSYNANNEAGTIAPEGTSVVNIYFDRNEYTLTFQVQQYVYTLDNTGTTGTHYGYYNGEYVQVYYNNGTWYRTVSGSWWSGYQYSDPYDGDRYTRSNNQQWTTIKEIKALYEQNIRDQFPIVGTNGITYDNGERWAPQNDPFWTQVMVYVETMPDRNVVFRVDNPESRPLKTMYYYVEALEGDVNTRTYNGKEYTEYNVIRARYNGVTEEDFVNLEGFTKVEVADEDGNKLELHTVQGAGNTLWYHFDTANDASIYFYYTRKSYTINYMDSVYVDGNNNVIDGGTTQLHESDTIEYGADISAEGDYKPTLPGDKKGYVFEGWFIDEACTTKCVFDTMPLGGVTVYAKWRQIQYRVFLHSNVDPASDDPDHPLTWGTENQNFSFRISYGGKVSAPTGIRAGYEFQGWYSDEALDTVFNAEAFVLNETTVKKDYDQTAEYTDPEWSPYGIYSNDPNSDLYDATKVDDLYNSDLTGWDDDNDPSTPEKSRYWIEKKLDLYAKWSQVIEGAEGIDIIYDENTQGGGKEGTAPTDDNKYKDNTKAVAGAASKPEDADNMVFSHWVVQKWNADTNSFDDTSVTVLPGGQFTVLVADAHKEDALDDEGQVIPDRYVYTIQLRAEYKAAKEEATPTHIPWFKNDGRPAFHIDTINVETQTIDQSTLSINKEVPIQAAPKRTGYTFLGWSKVEMGNTAAAVKTWEGEPSNWTQESLVSTQNNPVEPNFLYYNNGNFYTDSSFENKVTEVAADQNAPFHALFAVWEKIPGYYIYHSSTKGGDPVFYKMSDPAPDLTKIVATGYLYGGYYGYGLDGDGKPVKGAAYTVPGTRFNPTQYPEDTVYYLKEVPNTYLKPQIYLIWNETHNGLIQGLYGFVNVDSDEDYGSVGLIINGEEKEHEEELCGGIVVTKPGEADVTLGAFNLFGMSSEDPCFIGMNNLTSRIKGGAEFTISGYYVTRDGIRVTGIKDRYLKLADNDSRYNAPVWTGWNSSGNTICGLKTGNPTCEETTRSAGNRLAVTRMLMISAPSDKLEYVITKVYDSNTEEQTVEPGDYSGQITYTSKDGYMFAGWYQDEAFTVPADFSNVTGNMTVYAKYVSNKDVTVAFSRKSKKSNTTTFNATISVKNRDALENVTVNVNNDISAVLANKSVKKTGSGKNIKYTTQYKGTVAVKGLSTIDTFTASVSWTTPDGTVVTGPNRNCTYILGIVTVK